MAVIIMTGTSQGIGAAMAHVLLERGHRLVGISRRRNDALIQAFPTELVCMEADLADTAGLGPLMERIFQQMGTDEERVCLVNNAAVLAPLRNAEQCDSAEIARHMQINLIAPMILTSLFAKHTSGLRGEKRVLNISSGSARYLLPGMSCYCTAKAGLDTFTACVGLEQQNKEYPLQIASVWPGMNETQMQEEARRQDGGFQNAEMFIEAKKNGRLHSPDETARKLADLLLGESFPHGTIVESLY
ncbi:SDR family NAD(P)-dependent oxidoreductase [Paenibacillus nasutitermitis]|nr:SDR family NAD(P)-dependent oxidoreductase [Paenibacillus nasutitermitis]